MKIRKAKIEDVEQINPIIIELQELHINGREDIFKKKNEDDARKEIIEKILDTDTNVIVEINEKDNVCGVLICKVKVIENHVNIKDTRILSVEELGVKKEFKRQGIGRELMQKAKEIAKEEKCSRLELNCWSFNTNAMEFYKSIGMVEQRIYMEMKI